METVVEATLQKSAKTFKTSFSDTWHVLKTLYSAIKFKRLALEELDVKMPPEMKATVLWILAIIFCSCCALLLIHRTNPDLTADFFYAGVLVAYVALGSLIFVKSYNILQSSFIDLTLHKLAVRLFFVLLLSLLALTIVFSILLIINQIAVDLLFYIVLCTLLSGLLVSQTQMVQNLDSVGTVCAGATFILLLFAVVFSLLWLSSELDDIFIRLRTAIYTVVVNYKILAPFVMLSAFVHFGYATMLKHAIYGNENINFFAKELIIANFVFVFLLLISFKLITNINTLYAMLLSQKETEERTYREIFVCLFTRIPRLLSYSVLSTVGDSFRVLLLVLEKICELSNFYLLSSFFMVVTGFLNENLTIYRFYDSAQLITAESDSDTDIEDIIHTKELRLFNLFIGELPVLALSLFYFNFKQPIKSNFVSYGFMMYVFVFSLIQLSQVINTYMERKTTDKDLMIPSLQEMISDVIDRIKTNKF